MPAQFSNTWNASFESLPQDGEEAALGALRIRDFKKAFAERLRIDHSLAGDGHDGKHNKVTLRVSSGDPIGDAGDLWVYAKQVSGRTELFVKDSNGDIIQLTKTGRINLESFPQGTKLLFPQATAPTGWTIDNSFHDRVIRTVSGAQATGGATGGSWTISGLTVQGHALTVNEMPRHGHPTRIHASTQVTAQSHTAGGMMLNGSPNGIGTHPAWNDSPEDAPGRQVGGTGGNQPHSHGISHNGSWRPAYLNTIVAFKATS